MPASFVCCRAQPAQLPLPGGIWRCLLALLATLVLHLGPVRAQPSAAALPPAGRYLVTLSTAGLGRVQLLFALSQQADTLLTGTTATDLPRRLAGGLAARIVAKSLYDNGALAKLNLRPPGAKHPSRLGLAYQGVFDLQFQPMPPGAVGFRAELRDPRHGTLAGQLTAVPTTLTQVRPDYPALTARLLALAEARLYNPALLTAKPWLNYRAYMLAKAPTFADDGDLLFASLYQGRQLPFSHFFLLGEKTEGAGAPAPAPARFQLVAPRVALLDIPEFSLSASSVDSLMALVRQSQAEVLVLDLRRNPGGNLEGGMRLLQHLAARPLYGGTLLSQRWWRTHQQPPTAAEAARLPRLSQASYALFRQQRDTVAGLALQVEPLAPRFSGQVFVLVSGQTASAAEPVAFGIQYYKLGKVVGERTAGLVLSMEELPVDRYTFQLPMLNYYAPNGRELEHTGVHPDYAVAPAKALEFVLNKVRQNR